MENAVPEYTKVGQRKLPLPGAGRVIPRAGTSGEVIFLMGPPGRQSVLTHAGILKKNFFIFYL